MDRFIDVGLMPWTADPLRDLLNVLMEKKVLAPPAGIGHGSRPEGVVISYAVLEKIAPRISQVLSAPLLPQDLPVTALPDGADLRASLGPVLAHLAEHAADAVPVVIGRNGVREGALLSVPLFEQVARDIDLAQAAHTAALRIGLLDDPDFAAREFEAVCADLGVDPQAVREQMALDDLAGTGLIVSDEPSWNQP